MNFNFSVLKEYLSVVDYSCHTDTSITFVSNDSRRISIPESTLFIATKGLNNDSHSYIQKLIHRGVSSFIVEEVPTQLKNNPDFRYILVKNSLEAFQQIATYHRANFTIPIIGVTGSNGKTIVKEWLFQLLKEDYTICKTPGSYNSQTGVPISVLQLDKQHQLGIFEAGISTINEMNKLQSIIKPTIGIITNLGEAHNSGFESDEQKLLEKLKLFKDSEVIIYCKDHQLIADNIDHEKGFSWSLQGEADIQFRPIAGNVLQLIFNDVKHKIAIPFDTHIELENLCFCIATMVNLGLSVNTIEARIQSLTTPSMRLEVKEGFNNTLLIDDSYNNDLAGLDKALNFQDHQAQNRSKTLVTSDIQQNGKNQQLLLNEIENRAITHGINTLYHVGKSPIENPKLTYHFFENTLDLTKSLKQNIKSNSCILIKGAREYQFEKVINALEKKVHKTRFEINLTALGRNYLHFKGKANTKLMAMVKAFAYGTNNIRVAQYLEYLNVDYLGVAYTDEGVELRENNITTPIMVMNPDFDNVSALLHYNLEPEVFSISSLNKLAQTGESLGIHIKIDTGMHRLGFTKKDLTNLSNILRQNPQLRVMSIFSHLSSADVPEYDDFTMNQIESFNEIFDSISSELQYKPIKHILNSAGIQRFTDYKFDLVRLGIGLYGIGVNPDEQKQLEQIGTLKTTVSQVKEIKKGESIGYSRKGYAQNDTKIATIAIGYADGYDRRFGNGVGQVFIKDKLYPTVGNICMDMTMIEVGSDGIKEGDEVIVYGSKNPIYNASTSIGTIPYELLTHISERVKRVFYEE